jgi:hypothetical protein
MSRKSVVGLLAVITVFIFAFAAYGQGNLGGGDCYDCPKCPVGNIPCPGTSTVPGPQGTSVVVNEAAYPFDYDGNPYIADGFGSYGYCQGHNYSQDPERDCKFIFDVCSCQEACKVELGTKMGVQMIIGTVDANGNFDNRDIGVYFANPEMDTVHFDIRDQETDFCNKDDIHQPAITAMRSVPVYYDADGFRQATAAGAAVVDDAIRNFGEIRYYRNYSELTNSKGLFETRFTNEGTPLAGELLGAIPTANRVRALQSRAETDYVFTDVDLQATSHCNTWVDIPALRVDHTIAPPGTTIAVKVRFMFNRDVGGICDDCNPPDLCECFVIVGVTCCDTQTPQDTYCMYFPYVLQGIQDAGWVSGIAVTARGSMPAEPYCKLTLMDAAGNKASYTNNSVVPIWTFILDSVMSNFSGDTLVPGASSLEVISNYRIDGYSFLDSGTFGAATLPRSCTAGACCP